MMRRPREVLLGELDWVSRRADQLRHGRTCERREISIPGRLVEFSCCIPSRELHHSRWNGQEVDLDTQKNKVAKQDGMKRIVHVCEFKEEIVEVVKMTPQDCMQL